MSDTITIQPTGGGLGNNLMMIAGSIAYAKETGRTIRMFWQGWHYKNVPFQELFKPIDCIEIINSAPDPKEFDKVLYREDIRRLKGQGFDFRKLANNENNLYFETPLPFWPPSREDFFHFMPLDDLMAEIRKITNGYSPHMVGVHIRRTDNEIARNESPTAKFIAKMNEHLRERPETVFFISSDAPIEEDFMRRQFRERVVTRRKKNYQKYTVGGVRDAIVDMWCLSLTKQIIGSFYSSFSEVAAKIGNIKKVNIGGESWGRKS